MYDVRMQNILQATNDHITKVIESIEDKDTQIFILGDHGLNEYNSAHGGSNDFSERSSIFFTYHLNDSLTFRLWDYCLKYTYDGIPSNAELKSLYYPSNNNYGKTTRNGQKPLKKRDKYGYFQEHTKYYTEEYAPEFNISELFNPRKCPNNLKLNLLKEMREEER